MQEAWYAARATSTKDHNYTTSTITRQVRLHDEYNYMTSTITRRIRLHDKGHDYVYGIDDGKGLADGVGR